MLFRHVGLGGHESDAHLSSAEACKSSSSPQANESGLRERELGTLGGLVGGRVAKVVIGGSSRVRVP